MVVNLSKTEEQLQQEVMSKITLSKERTKLIGNVVELSKTVVDLSKKANVDIGATKARVVLVIDYSGSMRRLYTNGTVQKVVDTLVPVGLTFDDNGEIEMFRFSSDFKQFESLNISNYSDYIDKVLFEKGRYMGSTCYAPVLKEIKRIYIDESVKEENAQSTPSEVDNSPVFVIFITDGDNNDNTKTDTIIRELSRTNTFIQFIGIGHEKFKYLMKLDDLSERECDNTGFVKFEDIENVSSTELYTAVLEQYADWLKVKGY